MQRSSCWRCTGGFRLSCKGEVLPQSPKFNGPPKVLPQSAGLLMCIACSKTVALSAFHRYTQ